MQKSRIILTNPQLDFAASTEYPLMKHNIMQKQAELFTQLATALTEKIVPFKDHRFKISRGENYQLMPWMVLDLPAISGNDFEFTCRTLFWWGHYYSMNLLLRKDLMREGEIKLEEALWIAQGDDIWNNDFNLGFKETTIINKESLQGAYIRVGKKIDLRAYQTLEEESLLYEKWISLLMK